MNRTHRLFSAIFALLIASSALAQKPAAPTVIHVAPNGSDAWSGRLAAPNAARSDGPLATMAGARDLIRQWKARLGEQGPIRVLFAPGRYPLEQPVVFGPKDSGSAAAPISYEAEVSGIP